MLEAGAEVGTYCCSLLLCLLFLLPLTPPSPFLSSHATSPSLGLLPSRLPPTCSLSAEAAPTDSEKEVHTKVAQVLVKAPEILQELRSYKGAGELIREVGVASSVLQGGRGTN